LVTNAARFFGYQRTGADINRRMRSVLLASMAAGAIELRGDRYQLPKL